jgi:hypothetical protein
LFAANDETNLVICGVTAMHLGWVSKEAGIWLEDAMFCKTWAVTSSSFAVSATQASQQAEQRHN